MSLSDVPLINEEIQETPKYKAFDFDSNQKRETSTSEVAKRSALLLNSSSIIEHDQQAK